MRQSLALALLLISLTGCKWGAAWMKDPSREGQSELHFRSEVELAFPFAAEDNLACTIGGTFSPISQSGEVRTTEGTYPRSSLNLWDIRGGIRVFPLTHSGIGSDIFRFIPYFGAGVGYFAAITNEFGAGRFSYSDRVYDYYELSESTTLTAHGPLGYVQGGVHLIRIENFAVGIEAGYDFFKRDAGRDFSGFNVMLTATISW